MFKKIISKKIIIIASAIILGLLLFVIGLGIWVKSKKISSKIPKIVPVAQEEQDRIYRNLSPEAQEKMKQEAKKIRSITGKIQSIEARVLVVKVDIGDLKDKVFRINVLANAKIGKTEIDKITFVPNTVDFSFDKIKVDDKIIAWAKQDNVRFENQFDSEYMEVIVE
ncbi:hypothetical protein KKA09_02655 [Patescibacteria group bacterium]|nr:hypothetical protein [Patescibacteria group bacterium]